MSQKSVESKPAAKTNSLNLAPRVENFLASLDEKVRAHFEILEPDFPEWLLDYIETPPMTNLKYISTTCGTIYSKLFHDQHFSYSSLEHSIGVALIVWHFTRNKKQTLSGLFHDIATPTFKHCVDFLNGDYLTQESTEDLTTYIIEHSKKITDLLNRDHIKIEEIDNYHLYPIADNDTPQLSADRLEYSLSNGALVYQTFDPRTAKRFYNDLVVVKNEEGVDELTFKHKATAAGFVKATSYLSVIYRDDRTRFSMQFIADILKSLSNEGKIQKADLYKMKESEVIELIENSNYKDIWNTWRSSTVKDLKISDTKPDNTYYIHLNTKVRYIDPLATDKKQGIKRISRLDRTAANAIKENLSYSMDNFVTLGFEFTPLEKPVNLAENIDPTSDSASISVSGQPVPESLEESLLV